MKKITLLALTLISIAPLSACKTTAEAEGYKVTVEDRTAGNPPGHCPPGHHMKGRC